MNLPFIIDLQMAGNAQGQVATVVNEELAEHVADLMAAGWFKHSLKRRLEDDLTPEGKERIPISMSTYETLCRAAERIIRERGEGNEKTHRARSIAFYEQILRDDSLPAHTRLNAREKMDKVLGLQHLTLDVKDPAERAAELRAAMEAMDETVPSGGDSSCEGDEGSEDPDGDL